jgi:hypothetical protein
MDNWIPLDPWDTYKMIYFYSCSKYREIIWDPSILFSNEQIDWSKYHTCLKLGAWAKTIVPPPKKDLLTSEEIKEYCLIELKKPGKVFILPECFWTKCYYREYKGQPIWYTKDTTL